MSPLSRLVPHFRQSRRPPRFDNSDTPPRRVHLADIMRRLERTPEPVAVASDAPALVVETSHLTKIYQDRQIALNDVTLAVEPGAVLGLLGPNGAGKTTFLRLVLGLHSPTAGWCTVFGKRMHPNAADLRRRIGYIPTNPQFPRGMTPIEYLD